MDKVATPQDGSPSALLASYRTELVDQIWKGLAAVALVGTPITISRVFVTGWLPLYSFYLALASGFLALFLFRARLSFAWRFGVVIAVFWAIGLPGLLTAGLLGSGIWWLVMSALLVSVLHSRRAGLVAAALTTVAIVAVGILFITGVLTVRFDVGAYLTSSAAWASLLVAASVMPVIVLQAVGTFQHAVVDLLHELKAQRDENEKLATRDQLTGLPSLNLAHDRLRMALKEARRFDYKVAVLFIDLNGFKAVNDAHGHAAGDSVLKTVAERLARTVREIDTAARVGGDEFLVILSHVRDSDSAATVAGTLLGEITWPIEHQGRALTVGASIGIAVFPDHAGDPEALRRAADEAMYAVKRTGEAGLAVAVPPSPALAASPVT